MMETIDIKKAETKYNVHDLIKNRWSARSFTGERIDEEDLMTLFEAASWAPSSRNEQPWIYIYAHRDDRHNFKRFFDCLNEGNKKWAGNASVLVLSLARKSFSRNGETNRHYMHDTGSANTSLLLQAASMGIYGHMMEGFDIVMAREGFELPVDIEPVCFIALGYLDDPDKLSEPYQSRETSPRKRKALDDFVFQADLPKK